MFTDLQCPGDGACSNHGTCDGSTGNCICTSGFQGDMCEGKNSLFLTNSQIKYRAIIRGGFKTEKQTVYYYQHPQV